MKTNEPLLSKRFLFAFVFALGVSISASNAFATVIISDSTFNDSDWTATVAASTGGSSQTALQNASGGNPGAYRFMTHTLPGHSSIAVVHFFQPETYTPSTQGAITSLDYSEDRIQFNPPFNGAAIGATPLLEQGGVFFFGPDITYTSTAWTTLSLTGLTAANFSSGSNHPDFSASGTTIMFGYLRSNTNIADQQIITQHGIDNWSFTIHNAVQSVPDSGGMPLPLLGLLAISIFGYLSRKTFAQVQ